jgi:hypothetical protein
MKKQQSKTAFSLFELSIVMLVIAALVIGSMQGGELIRKAKVNAAATLTKSSVVSGMDGLVLWFETTMPNSFSNIEASDGTSITSWYDISNTKITANNATAGTSPVYTTNVLNGLPVVRFTSASSQYLAFTGTDLVNSNYTIFLVASRSSSQNTNLIIGGTSTTNFQNLHAGWILNTTPRFRIAHYGDGTSGTDYIDYVTTTYTSQSFAIHSFNFNSASGRTYYENGTQRASLTSTASKTPVSSWTGSAIGRFTTNFFNGDVAEVIMFNRFLNDTERRDVEQYLSKKWGITVS